MNKNLPDGWTMKKLGDIADEVIDRIDNPAKSGYERFVGLEHFERGSLTIKQWGSTCDVTSAMKLFKKGDVLFARRNAHLKRSSMTDFNGVCSGDAIVLRQKPNAMAEKYLSLILNTDSLWDYAISNAAGSMSKRVKWRDLEEFEFPSPRINVQQRIVNVLWAIEDAIRRVENAIELGVRYKRVLMSSFFSMEKNNHFQISDWQIDILKNILIEDIQNGVFIQNPKWGTGTLFLNVVDTYKKISVDVNSLQRIQCGMEDVGNYCVTKNDLFYVRSSLKKEGIAQCCIVENITEPVLFDCHLMRVRVNPDRVRPKYLAYLSSSSYGKKELNARAQTTTMTTINQTGLESFPILIPPISTQNQIIHIFDEINRYLEISQKNICTLQTLKNRLLNDLLSGRVLLGGVI
jgi:type I restriction enzyme, S subunit